MATERWRLLSLEFSLPLKTGLVKNSLSQITEVTCNTCGLVKTLSFPKLFTHPGSQTWSNQRRGSGTCKDVVSFQLPARKGKEHNEQRAPAWVCPQPWMALGCSLHFLANNPGRWPSCFVSVATQQSSFSTSVTQQFYSHTHTHTPLSHTQLRLSRKGQSGSPGLVINGV